MVLGSDYDGTLCRDGQVSREDLEYLYYYLCRIMFKGTENPELTVGEIIRLV